MGADSTAADQDRAVPHFELPKAEYNYMMASLSRGCKPDWSAFTR